jgi:hypothetical protein
VSSSSSSSSSVVAGVAVVVSLSACSVRGACAAPPVESVHITLNSELYLIEVERVARFQ